MSSGNQINIVRDALDVEAVNKLAEIPEAEEYSWRKLLAFAKTMPRKPKSAKKLFNKYLPITDWGLNYKFKEDLLADTLAGITVAIMHIPQGMAYANLAETDPIYGIYTAIFPVIIYTLLGPSKHVSMGTNPLTSLLVGTAVIKYATSSKPENLFLSSETTQTSVNPSYSDLQVITTLSLLSGIWQLIFAILGLGKLSWIMSDVLVSGYTTAAAIHVVASQIKGVFGISLTSFHGPLKLYYVLEELFQRIEETNIASILISSVSIVILIINNEIVKPKLSKKCSFPVPIQLIVVILGTVLSYFFKFNEEFNVPVVGNLDTGFPEPNLPETSLMSKLIMDSLIIAIVGYSITLSMAKIFGMKFGYSVDGNQEILSEGASNVFGSFLSCIPAAASMSRSAVQVGVGGRTQLTSAVSISLLIIVISYAANLFEELPKAILSSIILVALKSMLWQIKDFQKFFKLSQLDGALWMLTFLAVILLDIDLGLLVGVGLALLILIYRSISLDIYEIIETPQGSGIFVVQAEDIATRENDGLVLLQINGSLSFANIERVIEIIQKKLNNLCRDSSSSLTVRKALIVLDLSVVPYMDQSAAKAFKAWLKNKSEKFEIVFSAPTSQVLRMATLAADIDLKYFYPTTKDAIVAWSNQITKNTETNTEEDQTIEVVKE